jgi:predicted RNase H-like HicB family nuclease
MEGRFVLTDYVKQALALAVYEELEDGTFAGRISPCTGVIAFATTREECQDELRSVLEEWILLGLKLGHPLPVLGGIDLTLKPSPKDYLRYVVPVPVDRLGPLAGMVALGGDAVEDAAKYNR